MNPAVLILPGALGVGLLVTLLSSAYVVDEGRVGVKVCMGKAVSQEPPQGLQFKAPFICGVREFDVRERSVPVQIVATTMNQLSTTMAMTYNLRPDPARIMEIYVKYGGPEQFMSNVVSPRLNQSSKATVGSFDSAQLARERDVVAGAMFEAATRTLEAYPVVVTSAQLDDYSLPERYWAAILDKEEQREKTAKESLLLEQQGVQARQVTQTAEAQADATRAEADATAYATKAQAEADAEAIRLKAKAEADGIEQMQVALSQNPLVVEYEKAKRWDGALPRVTMGDQPQMLMTMPEEAR